MSRYDVFQKLLKAVQDRASYEMGITDVREGTDPMSIVWNGNGGDSPTFLVDPLKLRDLGVVTTATEVLNAIRAWNKETRPE